MITEYKIVLVLLGISALATLIHYMRKRLRNLRRNAIAEIETMVRTLKSRTGDKHAYDHYCEITARKDQFGISFDELSVKSEVELRKISHKALRRYRLWNFLRHLELKNKYNKVGCKNPTDACDLGMKASLQSSEQSLTALASEYRYFTTVVPGI